MYLISKTHCTAPSQLVSPNIFILKLDEDTVGELAAYVKAAKYVERQASKFGGVVAGVIFRFRGEFLDVPSNLSLDEESETTTLLVDAVHLDLFKPYKESDEVTCHQVSVWPDGSLYFQCVLDTNGFLFETGAIHISVITGDTNDRSNATVR